MARATVREAMTSLPRSIEGSKSAVEAAQLMASEDVGSLPVVEGEELVGMITDRDLALHVVARSLDPSSVTVTQVATGDPVVASPEEPLDSALQRMAEQQVRRLPVVDDGKLVGILAQADVARTAKATSTGEMVEQISQS